VEDEGGVDDRLFVSIGALRRVSGYRGGHPTKRPSQYGYVIRILSERNINRIVHPKIDEVNPRKPPSRPSRLRLPMRVPTGRQIHAPSGVNVARPRPNRAAHGRASGLVIRSGAKLRAMELLSTVPRPEIRRDARRNRDRILDIARARIAAEDYSLPLNLIAREAGVGVGTVYRHFPTSQSLLESAASDAFDDVKDIAEAARREPDARRALRLLIGRTLECMERRPELTAVLESSDIACLETLEMMSGFAAAVTDVLSRARRAGLIRRGITANDLRRLALGINHARRVPGGEPGSRETYLRVLLQGLSTQRSQG
jgi:AcrR family transcriptional regulator